MSSAWNTIEERRWFVNELSLCGFSAEEIGRHLSAELSVVHSDRRAIPGLLDAMRKLPHRKSKRRIAPLVFRRLDELKSCEPSSLKEREKLLVCYLEEWLSRYELIRAGQKLNRNCVDTVLHRLRSLRLTHQQIGTLLDYTPMTVRKILSRLPKTETDGLSVKVARSRRFILVLEDLARFRHANNLSVEGIPDHAAYIELLERWLDLESMISRLEGFVEALFWKDADEETPPEYLGYERLLIAIAERKTNQITSRVRAEEYWNELLYRIYHQEVQTPEDKSRCFRQLQLRIRSYVHQVMWPPVSQEVVELMDEALLALPDRDREYLHRYYGIGQECESLGSISRTEDCSRENVRLVREKSLSSLRTINSVHLAIELMQPLVPMRVALHAYQRQVTYLQKEKDHSTGGMFDPFVLKMLIRDTPLPPRAKNALWKIGIYSVRQLIVCSRAELLKIKAFGRKSLHAVEAFLKQKGLSLHTNPALLPPFDPRVLDYYIRYQPLDERTLNALQNAGIHHVRDLVVYSRAALLKLKGFGWGCMRDIDIFLARHALHLEMDLSDYPPLKR